MKRSRWVFLVVWFLLSFTLGVSAQSGTNLVVSGSFPDSSSLNDWTRMGTGFGELTSFRYRSPEYALTPQTSPAISYAQCINLSAQTVSVDLGGSLWCPGWEDGSMVFEFYDAADCAVDIVDTITLAPPKDDPVWGSEWLNASVTGYALPAGAHSVMVTLNGRGRWDDSLTSYFDDIFLYEYDATGVHVVRPSGRAPVSAGVGAGLVGLTAALLLLHRRRRSV